MPGLSWCVVSPQSVITRVTAAHDRERLWVSNVAFVVRLQARLRGWLVRREFAARRHVLREQWPAAIRIQVTDPESVSPLREGVGCKPRGGCSQHFPGSTGAYCSIRLIARTHPRCCRRYFGACFSRSSCFRCSFPLLFFPVLLSSLLVRSLKNQPDATDGGSWLSFLPARLVGEGTSSAELTRRGCATCTPTQTLP